MCFSVESGSLRRVHVRFYMRVGSATKISVGRERACVCMRVRVCVCVYHGEEETHGEGDGVPRRPPGKVTACALPYCHVCTVHLCVCVYVCVGVCLCVSVCELVNFVLC